MGLLVFYSDVSATCLYEKEVDTPKIGGGLLTTRTEETERHQDKKIIREVIIEELPSDLSDARIEVILPGPNIIKCSSAGGRFELPTPINAHEPYSIIWSQYPRFDGKERYGYQETQQNFEIKGALAFSREDKENVRSSIALIHGPLFHAKNVSQGLLRHSPYKDSVHFDQILSQKTIAIRIHKDPIFNRYMFLTRLV